jgi:hypothetical protein
LEQAASAATATSVARASDFFISVSFRWDDYPGGFCCSR